MNEFIFAKNLNEKKGFCLNEKLLFREFEPNNL